MTLLRELPDLATGNIGLLLDAMPDPLIVTDVEGDIVRLSKSAELLLGYSNSDLEGRPLAELIVDELRHEWADVRMAFLENGTDTAPELETRFVTADNGKIPIDASVGGLQLDGTPYLLLVLREVADRLATQNRLERMLAVDQLTTSVSSRLNTPDIDLIDRAIEDSIHELATFCGASAAYIFVESEPGSFVLHSGSRGAVERAGLLSLGLSHLPWVRTLLDVASISVVDTGPRKGQPGVDCKHLRGVGVTSLVVIPLRTSGRTIGFAGIESTDPSRPAWPGEDLAGLIVLQDVIENALERGRIGSELRKVNRVLQAVSQCHDVLIRAQDEKELLRDVCRIVVETGGYALAWVGYPLGNDANQIEAQAQWGEGPDYVESLQLSWKEEGVGPGPAVTTIRTRKPYLVQDTSKDQLVSWHSRPHRHGFLSLVTVPLFYGDEVAGVLAVYDRKAGAFDEAGLKVLQRFADDLAYGIAALRARERQREAESRLRELLESKDELMATIAHELRTPLAGVVGFAQLLRDEVQLDAESRMEMIRLIAEQSMDLTNIVDDLLVAAKSDAGTLTVASVSVDLRAQAAQVLEGWGSDAVARIDFGGLPAIATGDPARVRQILRNLISNALRYGGERVSVRVGSEEGYVYARVEDDGPGVAVGEREAIFDRYRRAHDAPGLTASMGLGLSISRHLAELMGGELTYTKEPLLSVFMLSMPTGPV